VENAPSLNSLSASNDVLLAAAWHGPATWQDAWVPPRQQFFNGPYYWIMSHKITFIKNNILKKPKNTHPIFFLKKILHVHPL
jgi:hypothetical protein